MAGYNSPEAINYSGKDNAGGAYVLGDNEALGVLHEHLKDTLSHIAKTKLDQQRDLNKESNVPMTGALDSDIYKYILPSKTKLTEAVAQMQQRMSMQKGYANSPEMFSDALAVKKQQDELKAMVAASVNRKGIIDRDTQLYSANPGKYKDEEFVRRQAIMRSKHPLVDAGIDTNLLIPQFNRTKFIEDWKKISGKETVKTEDGNMVTLEQNPIYDRNGKGEVVMDKTGNPVTSEWYQKFVEPSQEAHITKDAIDATIADRDLVDDKQGSAIDKAKYYLKQDMNKVMEQRYEKQRHFKPDSGDEFAVAPKEGSFDVTLNAGTPTNPIAVKLDYHRPYNTKKDIVVNNVKGVYDATTTTPLEGAPSSFKMQPSGSVAFTTKSGKKELAVMGTMLNYTQEDFETAKDKLWRERVAKVDPMFKDIVDLNEPGSGKLKKIADDNKPSDQEVENAMERSGKLTKGKTVMVPLEHVKGTLQQQKINTEVDEKAFKKLQSSSEKSATLKQVQSLVGKPGYEGYTEQELIDYYKKQGYTIK